MVNDCGDDNATDDEDNFDDDDNDNDDDDDDDVDDNDNDNDDNVKQDFIVLFFRISNHFGSFCCCYKCVKLGNFGPLTTSYPFLITFSNSWFRVSHFLPLGVWQVWVKLNAIHTTVYHCACKTHELIA